MQDEKIISRVKKMLALANDAGAAEGERDNALRMAYNLIAKYNLTMESIETHGQEQRLDEKGSFHGAPWSVSVTNSIAQLFFCKYYVAKHEGEGRRDYGHHFVGKESNAVTARYMAEFVVTSILNEGGKAMRREKETSAWWRSFCIGAADRIRVRVQELRQHEQEANRPAASTGTALVLADVYRTELVANDEWLKAQGVRLRKGGGAGRGAASGDGRAAGDAFGKTIQLNRQVGGSAEPLRLS
jgi:hypothetical protein